MTKQEFYILNSLYNGQQGRKSSATDLYLNRCVKDSAILAGLQEKGYIDAETNTLTEEGMAALEPFRVDNAVILAAGASTRFIPLSIEQPKGLYKVKDEALIERQICQLLEAGITDITIVLGYKKEMFYYLKERYPVRFIENPAFNIKNNIESLYLAGKKLKNTYICVSDSYFLENPFNAYEYESFYAGMASNEKTNELYVKTASDGRILSMNKEEERTEGTILLGHSFWKSDFSKSFYEMAKADREIGRYAQDFWENMVKENLEALPPLYLKEYKSGSIVEFDYFEDLRRFDDQYLGYTHSGIMRNIKLVFRCDEEDIVNFRNVSEGLTNTSFIFQIAGVDYIYRHPGDGTENIINRKNEKKSLIAMKELGIDPTYIYMDVNEGWKISRFVPKFREPDYSSFEDSKRVIKVMRELHDKKIYADYGMRPWEDTLATEELLLQKNPICMKPYQNLKEKIRRLYEKTAGDGVEHCFCHGDTYRPNWMLLPDGDVILIDWEYAGYSDPGIDVGYYIVDAMYEPEDAIRFVKEYLGENADNEGLFFHFMAYIPIIAYYWFVWALYRESCGANMGEALSDWYEMAVKYADYMIGKL